MRKGTIAKAPIPCNERRNRPLGLLRRLGLDPHTLGRTLPMIMGSRGPMDQFTAHLDRGWDLVNRGDYPGALLSAQKSLELDPESPEAHNLIGYIHQAEGRSEDALEHFRQAIAIDETYVEAMLNAAE